ncbi:MAG: helix-hairpin-helix domain-containing protein [Bacteroidales bacterium]|nr:helix-hairpin-helix domain-containing protein [Bacteroidales bacterium]
MWKDFFYFSKGQRTGILILIALILITVVLSVLLPYFYTDKEPDGSEFLNEAREFQRELVSRDSLRQLAWEEKYKKEFQNYRFEKSKPETHSLFPFDPNKADSLTFVRLGLRSYIASNILKFRSKGGAFRTKESFGKVYGLTPEKYQELEPYISIGEIATIRIDTIKTVQKTKLPISIIVELNSADTTQLMQVYGIGRGYAKGIVRFRQQTGGFVSVEQLREIYGMTDVNFVKISPYCTVNAALVQKIKVNTASIEKLNAHPYLNFYQSKAIYELRRNKGKLKSINDLRVLDEITPDQLNKINPYLQFD